MVRNPASRFVIIHSQSARIRCVARYVHVTLKIFADTLQKIQIGTVIFSKVYLHTFISMTHVMTAYKYVRPTSHAKSSS